MKDFFEELFAYNRTVNEDMIQVLVANNRIPLRASQLISHILLVHESWNNRMLDKPGLSDFWKQIDLNEMHSLNLDLNNITKKILDNNEMKNSFTYKNSKGIEFINTFQDVLFHLINHGTHHRGQINVLLRSADIEPVIIDFIFYKR